MDKNNFLLEFGKRVRKYRQLKGFTQEELANKMGYTSENARSTIQKIETGKSDLPASKIVKLASILNITINDLMG